MKRNNKLIILFLIGILSITVIIINSFSTRNKTFMEKNYLFCLTGISTENEELLKNEKFAIINVFVALKDSFPIEFAKNIDDSTLLMITWEPYVENINGHSILPEIIDGKYCSVIHHFATSCKLYGKPVMIRFGHEMNGNWYSWSGTKTSKDVEIYKNAYKIIYDIFKTEKCENVSFVFCVNYRDVPFEKWNRFENYYPGNDFVDYIGIDIYNWGNTQKWGSWFWSKSRWKNPKDIIEKPYKRIKKMAPQKPILLCEVGTTSSGGNKQKWIESFFILIKNRYSGIKGFVWFDYNKETDWAISHDKNIWDTYKKLTADDYFKKTYFDQEIFK